MKLLLSSTILFSITCLLCKAQFYNDFTIVKHNNNFKVSVFEHKSYYSTDWLKGLSPVYKITPKWDEYIQAIMPVIEGEKNDENQNERKCIRVSDGMIPHCLNYQIINGIDTIMVDSQEKFRKVFAPIESETEAIAFIYALTNYYPIFDLDFLCDKETDDIIVVNPWVVYQPEIESTYVHKTDDGYELLLFWYQVFGCSHPYFSAVFNLKKDGTFTMKNKEKVFENTEDEDCVD